MLWWVEVNVVVSGLRVEVWAKKIWIHRFTSPEWCNVGRRRWRRCNGWTLTLNLMLKARYTWCKEFFVNKHLWHWWVVSCNYSLNAPVCCLCCFHVSYSYKGSQRLCKAYLRSSPPTISWTVRKGEDPEHCPMLQYRHHQNLGSTLLLFAFRCRSIRSTDQGRRSPASKHDPGDQYVVHWWSGGESLSHCRLPEVFRGLCGLLETTGRACCSYWR